MHVRCTGRRTAGTTQLVAALIDNKSCRADPWFWIMVFYFNRIYMNWGNLVFPKISG
jgi:hypothetical protein